jgi:hypothetical protein
MITATFLIIATRYAAMIPAITPRGNGSVGNGKLNSHYHGKQFSHGNGKRNSHQDGKRNSHFEGAPVGYKETLQERK